MLGRLVKNSDYNFINEGTEAQKLGRLECRPTAGNGRVPGELVAHLGQRVIPCDKLCTADRKSEHCFQHHHFLVPYPWARHRISSIKC